MHDERRRCLALCSSVSTNVPKKFIHEMLRYMCRETYICRPLITNERFLKASLAQR